MTFIKIKQSDYLLEISITVGALPRMPYPLCVTLALSFTRYPSLIPSRCVLQLAVDHTDTSLHLLTSFTSPIHPHALPLTRCSSRTTPHALLLTRYPSSLPSRYLLQLAHPRLLAVDHTDTSLYLLTSRDPLELSGRVLCTLDLGIVNRQFDTGLFLDYDESVSCASVSNPVRFHGDLRLCVNSRFHRVASAVLLNIRVSCAC